jgi:hypothetical protein
VATRSAAPVGDVLGQQRTQTERSIGFGEQHNPPSLVSWGPSKAASRRVVGRRKVID